jgi:hypothetical protein
MKLPVNFEPMTLHPYVHVLLIKSWPCICVLPSRVSLSRNALKAKVGNRVPYTLTISILDLLFISKLVWCSDQNIRCIRCHKVTELLSMVMFILLDYQCADTVWWCSADNGYRKVDVISSSWIFLFISWHCNTYGAYQWHTFYYRAVKFLYGCSWVGWTSC